MNANCLFTLQTTAYATFYVIHVLILLAQLIMWIIDGVYYVRKEVATLDQLVPVDASHVVVIDRPQRYMANNDE